MASSNTHTLPERRSSPACTLPRYLYRISLISISPPIGLVICDEGHRLKSGNNKTTSMFSAIKTPRRIILSGTPIQNDLGEFHAMVRLKTVIVVYLRLNVHLGRLLQPRITWYVCSSWS